MILPSQNRRKLALFAVAGLLLAWAAVGGLFLPLQEESAKLDRKIREARRDLQQMREMADRHISLTASLPQGMRTDSAGAPLLAEAETISRRLGIEKNIKQMSPAPSTRGRGEELTVTISNIPYPVLVDFLQSLYESPSAISVRRAAISASFANRAQVNAELALEKGF
ncbi:MAG: type II secretion system protein M [Nitrospinae bacterium]|nr:type II secretion system protein M [Nitrospinota bacterium]